MFMQRKKNKKGGKRNTVSSGNIFLVDTERIEIQKWLFIF